MSALPPVIAADWAAFLRARRESVGARGLPSRKWASVTVKLVLPATSTVGQCLSSIPVRDDAEQSLKANDAGPCSQSKTTRCSDSSGHRFRLKEKQQQVV
jgi:hypothetical protein